MAGAASQTGDLLRVTTTRGTSSGNALTVTAAGNATAGGTVKGTTGLAGVDRATDPSDPANGEFIIWQSDGTGSGDDGDLMIKITDSGGTTKTVTLVDFSAA